MPDLLRRPGHAHPRCEPVSGNERRKLGTVMKNDAVCRLKLMVRLGSGLLGSWPAHASWTSRHSIPVHTIQAGKPHIARVGEASRMQRPAQSHRDACQGDSRPGKLEQSELSLSCGGPLWSHSVGFECTGGWCRPDPRRLGRTGYRLAALRPGTVMRRVDQRVIPAGSESCQSIASNGEGGETCSPRPMLEISS
jgi:hypothetical protein